MTYPINWAIEGEIKLSGNPDYQPIMQADPCISSNAPSLWLKWRAGSPGPGHTLFDFVFSWGGEARGAQTLTQGYRLVLTEWGNTPTRYTSTEKYTSENTWSLTIYWATLSVTGCVQQEVNEAKYLGVNITKELQWSGHSTSTTGKANSDLTFLRRNLKNCPQKLKEMAYISLVPSVLEYSSSIWDPYHAKDISSIERIQWRAARFVKSDYRTTSSVTTMLNDLGWKDLAYCRHDLRLALLHKVVYDHIAVSADSLGLLPGDKRLCGSGWATGTQFRLPKKAQDLDVILHPHGYIRSQWVYDWWLILCIAVLRVSWLVSSHFRPGQTHLPKHNTNPSWRQNRSTMQTMSRHQFANVNHGAGSQVSEHPHNQWLKGSWTGKDIVKHH